MTKFDAIIYLTTLANELDSAQRQGSDKDAPEGTRYIIISDTLAKQISSRLVEIVETIKATNDPKTHLQP
jgi:hypothetical protein